MASFFTKDDRKFNLTHAFLLRSHQNLTLNDLTRESRQKLIEEDGPLILLPSEVDLSVQNAAFDIYHNREIKTFSSLLGIWVGMTSISFYLRRRDVKNIKIAEYMLRRARLPGIEPGIVQPRPLGTYTIAGIVGISPFNFWYWDGKFVDMRIARFPTNESKEDYIHKLIRLALLERDYNLSLQRKYRDVHATDFSDYFKKIFYYARSLFISPSGNDLMTPYPWTTTRIKYLRKKLHEIKQSEEK